MTDTSKESEGALPLDFGERYLRDVLGLTQAEVDALPVHQEPEHPHYVEPPEKYKRLARQRSEASGGTSEGRSSEEVTP